jgi:hypothetical protein
MAKTPEEGMQSLISNLPSKTGKSLEQWFKVIQSKKISSYKEVMALLKGDYKVTHGFANQIALLYRKQAEGGPKNDEDLVDAQYAEKTALRPLYETIVKEIKKFGNDVVISPKKSKCEFVTEQAIRFDPAQFQRPHRSWLNPAQRASQGPP